MIRSCALAACCLVGTAVAAVTEPAGITVALRAAPGEVPAFALNGSGVQIYTCSPSPTGSYGWYLSAPDATLYDGTREAARLATADHWESLEDRSAVSGILLRMQAGGEGNLPWALMRALPAGETGMFAGVTSIQRVNTRGGVPPTAACGELQVGAEARVPFTADYYFYKRAGTG
jgi:hypothetical protein